MTLMSKPALIWCFPLAQERVSANCSRCSFGKAGRGSARLSPYCMTLAMLTLGPGELAPAISLSTAHWKRRLFRTVGEKLAFHVSMMNRVCVTVGPFTVTELLLAVVAGL